MKVELNRAGRKIELCSKDQRFADAFEIIKENGYERVNALDVENWKDVQWEGIEFNRLFVKDGIFYRFNNWLGEYPYKSVEVEEIGRVKEG